MADDNFVEDDAGSVVYDLDAELRKSKPPLDTGLWITVAGLIMVVLSLAVALVTESLIILLGGICFSVVLFGLASVIRKLDEVLYEIRRK
jgi:hypothetical protein